MEDDYKPFACYMCGADVTPGREVTHEDKDFCSQQCADAYDIEQEWYGLDDGRFAFGLHIVLL